MLSNKFICAVNETSSFEKPLPSPYLRKVFSLGFRPSHAEITICGLGFYRLFINGKEITKGDLAPYISEPNDLVYYDKYDITELLPKGESCIGIQLGTGFRDSFAAFPWCFEKIAGRGPVCTALHLEAEGDGKSFSLEADESFKTHPSPCYFNEWRMGCRYDARNEIPLWNTPNFDDSDWENAVSIPAPKGRAVLCPVKLHKISEIKPVSVKKLDVTYYAHKTTAPDSEPCEWSRVEGGYLFDFGVVTTGKTVLKINGIRGQEIKIHHADFTIGNGITVRNIVPMTDGVPVDEHLRYTQTDTYICKGGEEIFDPHFKLDCFRWCLVEGLKDSQITPELITFVEESAIFDIKSGFSCSSEVLNKLFDNVLRSNRSNMIYYPSDCPHRERNGWTGDASVSAEQFMLTYDCRRVLSEWLRNVRAAQLEDGVIPPIIPGGVAFMWGNGPAWDMVITELPFQMYKYTGDLSVITDNAEMINRYFIFVGKIMNEEGLCDYGLGDWCCPQQARDGNIPAPLIFTSSASLYDLANKAAFMFNRAGLAEYEKNARDFAEKIRATIREKLIDFDTMTVIGDCQTSQAYAIGVGIFNEEEIPAAAERLVSIIHRDGDENESGILGLRYMYHILSNIGYTDLAYKLVTSEKPSSFGYWIKNGATTMWEGFVPVTAEYVNSRNHHFFGDIASWLIQDIAGLRVNPDVSGKESCVICPHFPSELDFAEAHYDFTAGRVTVRWDRGDDGITVKVSAPESLPCSFSFKDILLPVCGEFEYTVNC